MKRCPQCQTIYNDETLRFCLTDGTMLEMPVETDPTIFVGGNDPFRVDIPPPTAPQIESRPAAPTPSSSGKWIKIAAVLVVIGFFAIAALGIAGGLLYYATGSSQPEVASKSPIPAPTAATPAATPDPERARLEKELADLQREVEKQKQTSANTDPFPDDTDDELGSSITATVNSPNDGFLALRAIPDAENGVRLAKIPHGAEVEIQNCEKRQTRIGDRTGRWCMVMYEGNIGWVFDAWLDY